MGKVFGIGLSKTGTTSLYAALAQLGYRTITYRHMARLGMQSWLDGTFDVDHLEGIDAATDLPLAVFFRDLDKAYPGSKFILTERPVEVWLKSAQKQFASTIQRRYKPTFSRDTHLLTYGFLKENPERMKRVYREHSAAVREHFASRPDDLLIFNLFEGHGWPELCEFLGRDVPNGPFPNVKPGYEAYPTPADYFPAYPALDNPLLFPPAPEEPPQQRWKSAAKRLLGRA